MEGNREIIKGANPSIIWTQFYDALGLFSKQMKAEYTKRMRANNPITWDDLDVINKKIHDKLDYIMTWSDEFKNESINKKNIVRLSESQLRSIIAESVKRVLRESDDWSKIQNQKGIEQIPSWALDYLINGVKDGLSSEEIAEIETWRREANIYDVCPPENENDYFCRYPAFGEPSSVYDCVCFYR